MRTESDDDQRLLAKINGECRGLMREIERLHPGKSVKWEEWGLRAKVHEIHYVIDGDRRGYRSPPHDGTRLGRAKMRRLILRGLLHQLKIRLGDPEALDLARQAELLATPGPTIGDGDAN